jgi:hypothetical protein
MTSLSNINSPFELVYGFAASVTACHISFCFSAVCPASNAWIGGDVALW